jgi:ASC-1-like (ASCH) protein
MPWGLKYMEIREIKFKFREVDRDSFEAIRNGRKKVETRAASSKYSTINSGDSIIIVCGSDKFVKIVKKATRFKSISEMLLRYKVEDINPFVKSEEELEKMYYSFPNYKEKIKDFGLMAYELK